jgi:radical SAM protein (TIGR04043 family)
MNRSLPLFPATSSLPSPRSSELPRPGLPVSGGVPVSQLLAELQSLGLRWQDPAGPGLARRGGAGPSDHKAISVGNQTIMVPIFTHSSGRSPYTARVQVGGTRALLERDGVVVREISFPEEPRFYSLGTRDGIPYWKIARLHGRDVLATTILQTCIRYGQRSSSCQFCAIGQSLAAKQTIAEKTPAQLAEVVEAAVTLDGIRHVVMTTGTPQTPDRGAAKLSACARAIRERTDVPIQGQCEPPEDFVWFERMREAGIDSLGMHLEAVSEEVRQRIMPGKAQVSLGVYYQAFEQAVRVFGWGQVSTYILAGLGDSARAILETSERLIGLGVYPFVVPFVPIADTPLEHHPAPDASFMDQLLDGVAGLLARAQLQSSDIKAGCGRCGACSGLQAREAAFRRQVSHA